MAIVHVQDGTSGLTFSGVDSVVPTFTSNATPGNVVVVCIAHSGGGTTVNSISGLGATWVPLSTLGTSFSITRLLIYAGVVVSATKTVTIGFSGTLNGCVNILEFSGCTLQVDGCRGSSRGTGTNITDNTYTPASANSLLVYSSFTDVVSSVTTPPTGFTTLAVRNSSSNSLSTAWVIQTTATAVRPNWVWNTSGNPWIFVVGLQATGTTTSAYIRQRNDWGLGFSGSSPITALAMTPQAGNTLIALVAANSTGSPVATVSDGTNSWQRAGSELNGTTLLQEIWYALNIAGSAVSIQAAVTGTISGGGIALSILEVVNVTAKDAIGPGNSGTAANPTDGGVTTTKSNDFIISAIQVQAAETAAEVSGYGTIGIVSCSDGFDQAGAWTMQSSIDTYTNTYTVASAPFTSLAAAFNTTSSSSPSTTVIPDAGDALSILVSWND